MTGYVLAMILFSLTWLPWKAEVVEVLANAEIVVYVDYSARPYAAGIAANKIIYWLPLRYDRTIGDLLHESQHYLACQHGMHGWDWVKFERVAMRELRRGGYSKDQILTAKYIAGYGGHELHAELPWIVKGEIPPCLQRWYPWFELEGAKEKR